MKFINNRLDDDDYDEDSEEDKEVLKTLKAQNIFNNPFSAFLASLSSIFFWFIYCLAKIIIVVAGIFIIFSFFFPNKCIGFLNRLIDQQKIEDKFRDEL